MGLPHSETLSGSLANKKKNKTTVFINGKDIGFVFWGKKHEAGGENTGNKREARKAKRFY